jgi:membrane protein implicated in regulation of membrane protease activity
MCHILLALPVVSLLLFWFLPFWEALFLYSAIVLICAILFWLIGKDMMRPAKTGIEEMIGSIGHVIQNGTGPPKVFYNGEIWDVEPGEELSEGDAVEIKDVKRMKLIVQRKEQTD